MSKLNYPYSVHPKPNTLIEVASGVYWLTMPMGGGSLNHINLYLLDDISGWWVIDTGLPIVEVTELWEEIFSTKLHGKPIIGVICTHMHPDHVGQAGMITNRFQCGLYMTRGEYYQARAFSNTGPSHHTSWLGEVFYERAGMSRKYLDDLRKAFNTKSAGAMSMPTLPSGFNRLKDGDILEVNNRDWEIVVGSGHSPEHACLYCADLKILISGDQILPIITSNVSVHPSEPEGNPLEEWMNSHQALLARIPDDTFVLPAHNLPFYGVTERLHQLISHHEERMRLIEDHCKNNPTIAKDLLPVLFERKLDSRQSMMALGEVIAHLHLMMAQDRIARTLDNDGIYRFTSNGK